jgi:hypothetical protein
LVSPNLVVFAFFRAFLNPDFEDHGFRLSLSGREVS